MPPVETDELRGCADVSCGAGFRNGVHHAQRGRCSCLLPQAFVAVPGDFVCSRHHAAPGRRAEDGLNEIGPQPWHTTLHFAVESVEPLPELTGGDPRLQRLPKYSLDMTQWRPDTGMISNSVMSINCGLAMLFYAEQAVFVPHLEDGISPMELVGATVDHYFDGARGYMMPNVNVYSPEWKSSRETAAYLVISAWYVIDTIGGKAQMDHWLKPMEAVADRIEGHLNKDGLVDEAGKEWFDARMTSRGRMRSRMRPTTGRSCAWRTWRRRPGNRRRPGATAKTRSGSRRCTSKHSSIRRRALCSGLEKPGWKAARLHVSLGEWLRDLPGTGATGAGKIDSANDAGEDAEHRVSSFELGLPTNLIPMSPADYFAHTSGAPTHADGMDTWQVYMNGGATSPYEVLLHPGAVYERHEQGR